MPYPYGNQIYPLYRELLFEWGLNIGTPTRPTGTLRVALMAAGYNYDAAHAFQTSLSTFVIVSQPVGGPDVSTGAVLDGGDVTFTALNNSSPSNPGKSLVIFMDTNTPGSSRLVAYFDSGVSGLSGGSGVISAGGNVNISWNASGIVAL